MDTSSPALILLSIKIISLRDDEGIVADYLLLWDLIKPKDQYLERIDDRDVTEVDTPKDIEASQKLTGREHGQ
jgi:hypothetical protein